MIDLEAEGQLYHMGAGFEALYMGILMAGSEYSKFAFFCILISGFEQSVQKEMPPIKSKKNLSKFGVAIFLAYPVI